MSDVDRRPGAVRAFPGPAQLNAMKTAATWSRALVAGTVLVAASHVAGLSSLSSPVMLIVAGLGFLAGVPHGGVDHLMAMRLAGGRPIGLVVAVYAALAATAWVVLRWGGPVALLVVITLSAVHFGVGELAVARELTGWRPSLFTSAALVVAGSGALLLPLARSGDQFRKVAAAVSPGLAQVIGAAPVRMGVLVLWLAAGAVAVTASLAGGHRSSALDIVLIGALGMLVQPLVAFAVWFGCWHAVRHCSRMLTQEPGCASLLAQGRRRAASLRLVRLAAPMSIAALTVVIALAWFTVNSDDPAAVLAEVLRLLLALTVPHMAVVWWLDRRGPGHHS